jgi:hypothetical protein
MEAEYIPAENAKIAGPQVERLNYGVKCKNIDFGLLNARNQLIKNVVNPLLDKIMVPLKSDRGLQGHTDQRVKYCVSVVVTATVELETVQ